MKVLVAEDSATTRAKIVADVSRLGHDVISAPDGQAAWEVFRTRGAEVIVSDWMMPGMDGPDLCRHVRAVGDAPYTYFILLTVLTEKRHVVEGMRAGADDFVTKPYDLEDLEARFIAAERVRSLHARLEQRARLEGALLAIRSVEHELNNQLSRTCGYAELLIRDLALPRHLQRYASESLRGAREAAHSVERLEKLTNLREIASGGGLRPVPDLAAP